MSKQDGGDPEGDPDDHGEAALNAEAILADLEPLEDLDDAEFGLPPVDNPPTLEEILAANDDNDEEFEDGFDIDDAASTASTVPIAQACNNTLSVALRQLNTSNVSGDTMSVHSKGSKSSGKKPEKPKKDKGSIMRHVILKGVSSQMASARDRADAGLPTAMAAGNYIAIGTSHGFVLVFDASQTLKFSLGGSNYGREFGSVSCLAFDAFNPTQSSSAASAMLDEVGPSRLLVGFAKGQLLEYDLTNGKLLRTLEDAHPLGSAIIRARFTDDRSIALICDAGGSVFELTLKRTLGVRSYSSRCIFSGSRGEVCTLEPLSLHGQGQNHPLSDRIIVALATISKVIVLTLRPTMKVLFTHPLTGAIHTLPLLSWQFVIIQTSKTHKVVDPVLAFGRQSTIFFYQLSETLSGKINFIPLQEVQLPYELLNLGWLNTRCMAFIDTSETFHLFDVRNQENLETIDLSEVLLVYGTAFFKGLATGGNVSAAMAAAGERSTYETFLTFTNQLILLGRNTFHVLMIRAWNERIEYLVKANNYLDCLALGTDFYNDQGKALVGLKGPREKKKAAIANKMLAVLLKYLDVAMTKNFPSEGNMTVLKEYFAEIVPPCVNVCMTFKRKDILFENVWNAFSLDPFAKATFLECLEAFILNDQFRNLPVNISQEFVTHYEITERFMALEACITHLNVTSLDIHQVMNICWQHGLYDAIIYVYNNGMLDYVTPAEELLSVLMNAMKASTSSNGGFISPGTDPGGITKRLTSNQIKLGNKLLVYISCCLAGRAYPYGDIQGDQVAQVKYDVYTCLTALHTKKANDEEQAYPYLRALLTFDTQGLLNVLSIAFEEPEFNSELGRCQKQRLVDILLQIMVHDSSSASASSSSAEINVNPAYSPSQVAYLFTFLARQIAKEDQSLTVSRSLFEQVLDVLTDTREKSHHEERQQALLDMLNAGGLEYFDRDHLIYRAKSVGFYRILEMLYEKGGETAKLLRCYIEDPLRQLQAFVFLQKVFLENANDETTSEVEKSVLADLAALIGVDGKKTAMVIYFHMYPYIPLVLSKLEAMEDKTILFDFMKALLEFKESGSTPTSPVHKLREDPLTSKETYERYIDLMARFEPKTLSSYLRSHSHTYRSEAALKICVKHGIKDGQAYLLEQQGRLDEAFDLMKADLEAKIAEIISVNESDNDKDLALLWTQVNANVIMIVQLCQSHSLNADLREKLWFSLLDSLMKPQAKLKAKEDLKPFKDVVRHVVNSALGYISLRAVVDRILRDPVYQEDSFGDVQDFVREMLEMYHYEETLMLSTCQAIRSDIHGNLADLQKSVRRGHSVHSLGCGLCHQHLAKQCGRAVIFQCSHKFHASCLKRSGCLSRSNQFTCYTCMRLETTAATASKSEDSDMLLDHIRDEVVANDEVGDEAPEEIVNEITNQRVVKAHAYMAKFKSGAKQDSIFDRDNFALELAPQPESDDIGDFGD